MKNFAGLQLLPIMKFSSRDDTNMTFMKVSQFSRPPTPLSIYVEDSSTPLTLDIQFQTNPPPPGSPNDNQSI